MTRTRGQDSGERRALDLLEDALGLLKRQSPGVHALYVIGTVPFVLGFLFFWVDMSWNSFAAERCAGEALILVFLFLWMKTWQAAFAGRLRESVRAAPPEPWTFIRVANTALAQALVHPTAVFVLPLSLLAILPFGWAFAFYQNFTVLSSAGKGRHSEDVSTASSEAMRNPRQNYAMLGILLLWAVVLFLDINLLLRFLPFLLRSLLGIETVFTRRPIPIFNTTALIVSASITWWCVDPVLKAAYVLRCFYGRSIRTGEDLLVELRALRFRRRSGALLVAILIPGFSALSWSAAPVPAPPPRDVASVNHVQRLDRAIRDILEHPRYAWRLPRVRSEKQHTDFLLNFVYDAIQTVVDSVRRVTRLIGRALDWLAEHLFPKPKPKDFDVSGLGAGWVDRLYVLAVLLLALVISCLVFVMIRNHRRKQNENAENDSIESTAVPDVEDEYVSPDALLSDRWLRMAREFAANGDFRLAIRTIHLAGLALLAEKGLITLARHKSNREYLREVERHTHAVPETMPRSFQFAVVLFDKVWYGRHAANAALLIRMQASYESLKLSAKNL